MARENNFLLGYGERLTDTVKIKSGGGRKEPPYDFFTARSQVSEWLRNATDDFKHLPREACPNEQVTAVITMHPRYISKSDFPKELFDVVEIKPVGGRSRKIKPKEWGISKHPEEALTDEFFVMGDRKKLEQYSREIANWTEHHKGSSQLTQIEFLKAYNAEDKIKPLVSEGHDILLEVVLHDTDTQIVEAFEHYAIRNDAKPIMDRLRYVKGLAFIPIYTSLQQCEKLAQFSFVRVVRAMPTMRPLQPSPIRRHRLFPVALPDEPGINPTIRTAIFDGGIPSNTTLSPWVNLIEPDGIVNPIPFYQEHGLAVTSSFLFGPLKYFNQINARTFT